MGRKAGHNSGGFGENFGNFLAGYSGESFGAAGHGGPVARNLEQRQDGSGLRRRRIVKK